MFIHALELAAVLTWNFNDIYGGCGQFLIGERGIFSFFEKLATMS